MKQDKEKIETKEIHGEVIINGQKYPTKMVIENSDEKKKINKITSMRMAMTFIEVQNLKKSPEEVIKIAETFLKWLDK